MINQHTFNDQSYFGATLAAEFNPSLFIRDLYKMVYNRHTKIDWRGVIRLWFIEDLNDGDYCFIATQDERELSELLDIEDGKEPEDCYYFEEIGTVPMEDDELAVSEVIRFINKEEFTRDLFLD